MNLSSVGRDDGEAMIRAGSGADPAFCRRTTVASFAANCFRKTRLGRIAGCLVLGISLLSPALAANGGEPIITEAQIKAAFLLNFPKYIEWPPESFSDAEAPVVMAVYGDDEVAEEFRKLAESKKVGGRRVEFRQLKRLEDSGGCHVLFIGTVDPREISEIVNHVRGSNILTVGQADDFLDKGGVINLARRDRKIRVDINLHAARQANLKISSKLLTIAENIKGQ